MTAWDTDVDTDFSDIILDEKLCKEKNENILIYNISYKNSPGAKPLHIRYNKMDEFVNICNRTKHLVLFDGWCDKICDRIKYDISEKNGIADSIKHNFAIIRIDSYNSLPIEKILTFHNVTILIKSVVNKNENEYYYNIVLEKGSYKDKSNIKYF